MEEKVLQSLITDMGGCKLSKLIEVTVDSNSAEPSVALTVPNVEEPGTSSQESDLQPIVFSNKCEAPLLFYKWPKIKSRIPSIFLHNPFELGDHVVNLLTRKIRFYKPRLRQFYSKVTCVSMKDYKQMKKYLDQQDVAYHTFGQGIGKHLEFAIKGLPTSVDACKVRTALRAAKFPVRRIHKIQPHKKSNFYILVITLPLKDACKKILWVKKIFGYDVTIDEPLVKPKQCIRCQRWEHTQKYCKGDVRCVFCGEYHYWRDCNKDFQIDYPSCANCCGRHTADYKKCHFCPISNSYKSTELITEVMKFSEHNARAPPEVVTFQNCDKLYANLKYTD